MSSSMYDELYETLVPYGTYLQMPKSVIMEGRTKGFPVEAVVSFATGLVIASFFKGFFGELGKLTAQKTIERILVAARSKKKFDQEALQEIDALIKASGAEVSRLSSEDVESAYVAAKRELEGELVLTGIPSYRIGTIVHICSVIMRARIIELDSKTDITDE